MDYLKSRLQFEIPGNLTNMVKNIQSLGRGGIFHIEESNPRSYEALELGDESPLRMKVTERFIKDRGIKDLDSVIFVKYRLTNLNMEYLDIFKAKNQEGY